MNEKIPNKMSFDVNVEKAFIEWIAVPVLSLVVKLGEP